MAFAMAVEIITTFLSIGGLIYMLLALWGARSFNHHCRRVGAAAAKNEFAPDVSILKPVKGLDARMHAGFVSHCMQQYGGKFEILLGVSSMDDPAVAEVERLRAEFPDRDIHLIVCPERLGTSGKVSNLVQMLRQARYDYILINDSDIRVSPDYLSRVMACFGPAGNVDARGGKHAHPVGMVTAPYLGRTAAEGEGLTLWARLEALGISTDFLPGVLTARFIEDGIRFGLGSTLAVSREALTRAGGLESLVDYLADDYELGARIAAAGYRVELCGEPVETTVPAYRFRGFWDHQMRWARSTRDSRRWGYAGLGITYCVPWAVLNCIASGFALWSFTLLSLVLLARVTVALSVGVGILRDGQVLRDLWLLPLRDFFGLGFWVWSFASNHIVWRGEHFYLNRGRITRT
ncbi:MAG TPA: bacteriohopanetetrol glucosamine biosynthesis glycosyltransferase HpnI [Acidobacteriaceae bacterium]|nr:bacteriohopanetetrol glucosamine biosynthesis glycosyltransferase HpnI [Acidobacteriaceae bacterium]